MIDRQFSCYETINLLVQNNYHEALIWNSEQSKFDGIITHSDLTNMILTKFREYYLQLSGAQNSRLSSAQQQNTRRLSLDAMDEEPSKQLRLCCFCAVASGSVAGK